MIRHVCDLIVSTRKFSISALHLNSLLHGWIEPLILNLMAEKNRIKA